MRNTQKRVKITNYVHVPKKFFNFIEFTSVSLKFPQLILKINKAVCEILHLQSLRLEFGFALQFLLF